MSKIPFKVSARTARLIGRENISSSKGAIIELVKNGYDADSPLSIVYFDNKYSRINNELSIHEYMTLINKGIPKNILEKTYTFIDEKYLKKIDISEVNNIELKNKLKNLNCLYIIDSGEGMTQKIIREHWMTIGTDNKSVDIFTKTGRVKAGAKGIGRFALDKLGSKCEMITIFNPSNHETDIDENNLKTKNRGYIWKVNWSDFEGEFKTIDKVNAELHGIKSNSLKSEILKNVEGFDFSELFKKFNFEFGTILKISELRDDWDDFYVNQVFNDLEVLVPPKENSNFSIFLFSSLNKNLYGEITGSVCDDYDYKIEAKADKDQNI
ncbi:MAG TPA: ATP-binding protein, partial [Bacteroidetes bacterium]|nr:ATP-binding protein [Bacteroidota bacterium]